MLCHFQPWKSFFQSRLSQLHHISKHNVTKAAVYDTLVTLLFQFYYSQYIFYKSHIFINNFMLEPTRNSYAWISNPFGLPWTYGKKMKISQNKGVCPNLSFIFPITNFSLSLYYILPKLKVKL